MKTPREILLERHQAVAPKLDAIRRATITELNHQDTKTPSWIGNFVPWCLGGFSKIWLELIFPCRRIWAGLAAVWLLIFIVNFSQRDPSEFMALKSPPPSPQMILAYRQQEKLLAELIGPNEPRAAEPPSKTFSPQPRSERQFEILMT